MDRAAKKQQLAKLREEVRRLEAELRDEDARPQPPPKFYAYYYVMGGCVLGMFGASTSLLLNVVGSLIFGKHPLELIRVYLTFPLGAEALDVNDGVTLAIGCCLYLATGMLLGIPFNLVLNGRLARSSLATRFAVVSALALGLWLFLYYAVLLWLQPLLFGGRWIVDLVPPGVAALTHLVFGWTMLLVQPLGVYVPYYRPATEG
jgi:hypothetical protein